MLLRSADKFAEAKAAANDVQQWLRVIRELEAAANPDACGHAPILMSIRTF
jgi:hypothetical protein